MNPTASSILRCAIGPDIVTGRVQEGICSLCDPEDIDAEQCPLLLWEHIVSNDPAVTYSGIRTLIAPSPQKTQQQKNQLSSLTSWQQYLSLNNDSPVGPEFSVAFPDLIEKFRQHLADGALSVQTQRDRVSHIRRTQAAYMAQVLDDGLPAQFHQCLDCLIKRNNFKLPYLVQDLAPLGYETLTAWICGKQVPSRKFAIRFIPKLETLLSVPSGTLTRRLEFGLYGDRSAVAQVTPLEFRNQQSKLLKMRYILPTAEVPEHLKAEWTSLLRFKTEGFPTLTRSSSWRCKPADRVSVDYGWHASIGANRCPSANKCWPIVAGMLGYAMLATEKGGLGLSDTVLTLAAFADPQLVKGFVEFRKERASHYNKMTMSILQFACHLLRPISGYLWQLPEFGSKYHRGPLQPDEWREQCARTHKELHDIIAHLKKGRIQMTRDPRDPIAHILQLASPIQGLVEMVDRMEKATPSESWPVRHAVHKRDLLLIKLLICNPLRLHHYVIMTWTPDNRGNVYQRPDGSWWLRFKADDFKNQHGAASEDYDVELSRWVWPDLEAYVKKYRPLLGTPDSKYLLRPKPRSARSPDGKRLAPGTVEHIIRSATGLYGGGPAFGPHAFRHIIATDYILNHPEGYVAAAAILHDKIDTVMRNYSHLRTQRGVAKYSAYLEGITTNA